MSPGQLHTNLYFLTDSFSGIHYLVDTGAAVSVLPVSTVEAATRPMKNGLLVASNGTSIPTYGLKTVTIKVGTLSLRWPFLLAKVSQPIIGADFLRQSGLLVDVLLKRLVKADTGDSTRVIVANLAPPSVASTAPESEYARWIKSCYPALITPTFAELTVKHGITMQIPTKGRPVFARARRLLPDKLAVAKAAFEEMCGRRDSP